METLHLPRLPHTTADRGHPQTEIPAKGIRHLYNRLRRDAGRAGVYGELLYQSRTTAEPLLPRSHATVDSPRRQILHLRPEPGMGNDVLRPMDLFVRLGTARRIVGI